MKQELWRRAEDLFHAALKRPPKDRQAFLDEACGEDAELRQQVEQLISKDEQAGNFLEKPVLADVTETQGAAGSHSGRQYGPYRILSPLGAGGAASSALSLSLDDVPASSPMGGIVPDAPHRLRPRF